VAALGDQRRAFNQGWWPVLWFLARCCMFIFMFIWLRGTLPAVALRPVHEVRLEGPDPGSLAWIVLVATFRALRDELRSTNTRSSR
jgi:NADH-quinone oxidoreductase subunit H